MTRQLESRLAGLGGRKLLYSNSYYDWPGASLWEAGGYDRGRYEALREAVGAAGRLPSLTDKVLSQERDREDLSVLERWQIEIARFLL